MISWPIVCVLFWSKHDWIIDVHCICTCKKMTRTYQMRYLFVHQFTKAAQMLERNPVFSSYVKLRYFQPVSILFVLPDLIVLIRVACSIKKKVVILSTLSESIRRPLLLNCSWLTAWVAWSHCDIRTLTTAKENELHKPETKLTL